MSDARRQSRRGTEWLLRRVALLLLVAICGLVGGLIAWGPIRAGYFILRSRSSDADRRVAAINVLAGLCTRDDSCAEPFVESVVKERQIGTAATRKLVDEMAVWALERSEAARDAAARKLDRAEAAEFLHLADVLRRSGHWRAPERSSHELARREILRMREPGVDARVSALHELDELGPTVWESIGPHVDEWLRDPDVAVRVAAVQTVSICGAADAAGDLLSRAQHDDAPAVRREAMIRAALLGIDVAVDPTGDDAVVRQAAAWGLGVVSRPGSGAILLRLATADADSGVRAMSAWGLGQQREASRAVARALAELILVSDEVLSSRAAVAAGRLGLSGDVFDSLSADSAQASPGVVFALGQLKGESPRRSEAVDLVKENLERALRDGDGSVAAACCEALASLQAKAFIPVLCDIAAEMDDQPMLQYAAGAAALQLDVDAGTEALFGLLDGESDPVCDRAAIRVGLMEGCPVVRLARLLESGGERERASAALALGFAGAADVEVAGGRLVEFLRVGTEPGSPSLEPAWKPHGYYLCARLVLGDGSAREALDPFIRNENFPRIGLYAALLRAGDPLPMNLLLARESSLDVESFLGEARFIEIIRGHFPDAPTFDVFEDEELRRWQVERLRDWWAVQKRRNAKSRGRHKSVSLRRGEAPHFRGGF